MENAYQPLDLAWVILCAGLVFLMQAGFLCLESGLTRTKNSINVAVKNITDFGLSVFVFWTVGFGLMFGTSTGGIIGTDLFFADVGGTHPWLSTFFIFQAMFCGTAVTIVSGAVAERMTFAGYLFISIFVALVIYPVFGHWAWGGAYQGDVGWLARIGFIDFAGSSVVHSVGGWVSLVVIIFIGPRIGRFSKDGTSREIQGQHLPFAMLGALLLCFGWIGFNGGSTLALNGSVPGIVSNTMLGGTAGLCCSLGVGWIWKRFPNPKHPMNGLLAGLVAVTANCHIIAAWQALVIGAVAGVVVIALDHLLESFKIDDVVGAFSVHTGAGVWGTLSVALFGNLAAFGEGVSRLDQLGIQLTGIVTCFAISVIPTTVIILAVKKILPLRVSADAEHRGLNAAEHQATTEYLDLLLDMEAQAKLSDLTKRVRVEPFTEAGQIASKYNEILDSLQITIARNEMIVRDTSDGIVSCSSSGDIISVNPGAQKMFQLPEDDFIGLNVWKFFDGIQTRNGYTANPFALRETEQSKISGIRSDGTRFPVEIESSERNIGDRSVFTLKVRDITQRITHREQLTRAKEAAENARDKLQQKVGEIEAFNQIAVDREIRMMELKESINRLSAELGRDLPFPFENGVSMESSKAK
jgi:ammonium transporter, Amt family